MRTFFPLPLIPAASWVQVQGSNSEQVSGAIPPILVLSRAEPQEGRGLGLHVSKSALRVSDFPHLYDTETHFYPVGRKLQPKEFSNLIAAGTPGLGIFPRV